MVRERRKNFMKKRISLLLSVWLAVSSALCGCNMVLQKMKKSGKQYGFSDRIRRNGDTRCKKKQRNRILARYICGIRTFYIQRKMKQM